LRVAAVILAAGGSTRLGRPKQLLPYGGEVLVSRIARLTESSGCSPVVMVTGARASEVEAALQSLPLARTVFNPDWETGMGSSVSVGVSAALQSDIPFDAVLLLVCDQPLISETLLRDICETFRRTGRNVVASEYNDVWGVPCLFDRSVLPELVALRGASGAKSVIERYRKAGDAISVPFPGGALDVDTPADWERSQTTQNIKSTEPT
jgi:molybdenum cofactor cytidylyltransferase